MASCLLNGSASPSSSRRVSKAQQDRQLRAKAIGFSLGEREEPSGKLTLPRTCVKAFNLSANLMRQNQYGVCAGPKTRLRDALRATSSLLVFSLGGQPGAAFVKVCSRVCVQQRKGLLSICQETS